MLVFFLSPISDGSPAILNFLTFFSSLHVPCASFYLFLSSNAQFLHLFPSLSFSLPLTLNTLFSHVYPCPPVWQSCARCHVAATVFAQRASAGVRRVGLVLRATREHAILAVKNTASATTGPASANQAGRENTVTLVSCVLVHVGVFNYSL